MIARLPNLLVMCVSHSGSTVTMRMLEAAGWRIGSQAGGSREDMHVIGMLRPPREGERFDQRRALRSYLAGLPEPWAIKTPHLCFAAHLVWDALEGFERSPVLVWLTRDMAEVEDSHRRRGQLISGEPGIPHIGTVAAMWEGAQQQFERWPGSKLRVAFEDIERVVGIFDPSKIYARTNSHA